MVALLYWIAKLELETIKVEIADFPFFSHQFTVELQSRKVESTKWLKHELRATLGGISKIHFLDHFSPLFLGQKC